eukprot:scaffold430006_cov37-Prasinocladus_malaysianus.AAC.1
MPCSSSCFTHSADHSDSRLASRYYLAHMGDSVVDKMSNSTGLVPMVVTGAQRCPCPGYGGHGHCC